MKKSMARIISVLLVALMAISMIPAVSAADDTTQKEDTYKSVLIDKEADRSIKIGLPVDLSPEYKAIEGSFKDFKFVAYQVATFTQVKDNTTGAYFLEYKNNTAVVDNGTGTINAESTIINTPVVIKSGAVPLTTTYDASTNMFTVDGLPKDNAVYLIRCLEAPEQVKTINDVLVQVPNVYDKTVNGWQYTATVYPKMTFNGDPTPTKNIVTINHEDHGNGTLTSAEAGLNDVIGYKVKAPVLGSSSNPLKSYYVTDTMSKGLTLDKESIKITYNDGTQDVDITDSFDITFSTNDKNDTVMKAEAKADLLAAGSVLYTKGEVTLTYSATVNENAVLGKDGNVNEVVVSNNGNESDPGISIVYTYGIQVVKKDKDGTTLLEGAEFILLDENNTKVRDTQRTNQDGIAVFTQLAPGKYYLVETKAPENYQLLADPIEVEVKSDTVNAIGLTSKDVINTKFATPATGGIGSTIFVVSGLAIIALGGALFFIASRKRESK